VKSIRAVPLDTLVVRAGDTLLGYSADILTAIGYAVTTIFLALYLLRSHAEPKPRCTRSCLATITSSSRRSCVG